MNLRIPYIVLFVLLSCLWVNAQQYNFINYDIQEGLPNSNVKKIFQDSKSYLWIATEGGGVCAFDGVDFEVINTKQGLASNVVHDILEDDQNTLWVGTQNGLCAIKNQNVQSVFFKDKAVLKVAIKNADELWLGTDSGLYILNKESGTAHKFRAHPKLNIAKVNDILQIGKNHWVATNKGLFILNRSITTHLDIDQDLLQNEVNGLAIDKNKKLWIAQKGGGVLSMAPNTKKVIKRFTNPSLRNAQTISVDNDKVWVGTKDKGLQIYDQRQDTWQAITRSQGLANNDVQVIAKDDWANVWIGSKGGGIDKFLGQYFTHYNSNTGLNGNQIYAIAQDRNGKIWLAVDDKGVSTIDSTGIQTDVDAHYINSRCNHIMEDSLGRLWFSTAGGGLVMKDSSEYWVFNELDGLPSRYITASVQDDLGNIWVGTKAHGIAKIVFEDSLGIEVELYNETEGLPDPFITVMQKDNAGIVWFGTKKGGLGYIEDRQIISISRPSLPDGEVSSMAFAETGQLWLGVKGGRGLYSADLNSSPLKFVPFAQNQKLSSTNIEQLVVDRQGRLWVGSSLGLDKIIFNKSQEAEVLHFGKNEGFIGIETNRNAVIVDRDGHLWFGTRNGLSKHTPGKTKIKTATPKVNFTDITLMYQSILDTEYARFKVKGDSLAANSIFKHHENNIGFSFKAINIDFPSRLMYSWKLEGFDEEWSPYAKTESANYTNLPPGKYRFKVKAQNQIGLSSAIVSSSFEIKPALWQSVWFQLAFLFVIGLLTYLFFRYRVQQVKNREKAKRVQLEMQNELLSLEQKALQLQMNPHFIFNALNSIQSVVVTQKTDVARDQIQNFAGLMRGILTNSKKQSITLQEEYHTIDKYLKLEQFCQTKPFDYEIIFPEGYDPDEIVMPPMMIQPFVENAVFHGVSHLEEKGMIKVIFTIENDLLSCEIIDNGVGRKKAATMSTKKAGHQSVALEVTRQRLESLRGSKKYTAFSIDDVLNEIGEVRGTKVSLKLPLELTF